MVMDRWEYVRVISYHFAHSMPNMVPLALVVAHCVKDVFDIWNKEKEKERYFGNDLKEK